LVLFYLSVIICQDLHNLCPSPNIITDDPIKRKEVGTEHAELTGERKDEYKILAGKPKRRKIPVKSGHRWEDNIKKDLRQLGWDGVECIDMAREIRKMAKVCYKINL
jgi:hypothetical protein